MHIVGSRNASCAVLLQIVPQKEQRKLKLTKKKSNAKIAQKNNCQNMAIEYEKKKCKILIVFFFAVESIVCVPKILEIYYERASTAYHWFVLQNFFLT